MMELMDQASINAVEDYKPMGLDRNAGALLIAQSDAPGAACAAEIAIMEAACTAAGATEVFVTDDAEEGEMFVAARRAAFPAIEARGADPARGCRAPRSRCCRSCWPAIAAIAEKYQLEIPVVAHAGDGNTHPIVVFDPDRPRRPGTARSSPSTRSWRSPIALGGTITGEHGVGRTKKAACRTSSARR